MTNTARNKGTKFETEVLKYLRSMFIEADKMHLAGTKDEGDIVAKIGGLPFVLELKACEKMSLSGWIKEAATEATHYDFARKISTPASHFAVVHKKRGASIAESYVTLPLYEWLRQVA